MAQSIPIQTNSIYTEKLLKSLFVALVHRHTHIHYKRTVCQLSPQSKLLLWLHNLFRVGGALKALRCNGSLMRHALPHDVPFPPEDNLLQQGSTKKKELI